MSRGFRHLLGWWLAAGWEGKLGSLILIALLAAIVIGPLFPGLSPNEITGAASYSGITREHWLGTDYLGRDVLARILYGGRVTLSLAFLTAVIGCAGGTALGFTAALSRKWADSVTLALVDLLLSVPAILLALVVLAGVGPSVPALIFVVSFIHLVRVTRVARSLASGVVALEYVEVAKARGDSRAQIALHDILPNTIGPVSVEFGLRLTFSILLLSALSFLGLGVQPPIADWGAMVRENLTGLRLGAPAAIAPAAAIAALTLGINLLIDANTRRAHSFLERGVQG